MIAADDTRDSGREQKGDETVDVVALMEDLRRRVALKKAAGLYTIDAIAIDRVTGEDPVAPDELERLRELAVQQLDLAVSPSTKPGLGKLVTKVKRVLVRGTSEPLIRASTQANEFNTTLLRYIALLGREVRSLQRDIGDLQTSQRDSGTEDRLETLERGLAGTATAVDALHRAALADRVGRLENLLTTDRDADTPPDHPDQVAMRLMVEARVNDGDAARARWTAYAAAFGSGPVLQLGAGTGRALEILGSESRGVEQDRDLVAVAHNADRPVELGDPVAHLTGYADASLPRVLVTGLVEHLPADRLSQLAAELARSVAPGGHVIVEGANPTTLSPINDWSANGPGRQRHPDVVQMLLEGAGFASTRVEFPAPGAAHSVVPPTTDPALQAISQAVEELSANVYGPSHYAVHGIR